MLNSLLLTFIVSSCYLLAAVAEKEEGCACKKRAKLAFVGHDTPSSNDFRLESALKGFLEAAKSLHIETSVFLPTETEIIQDWGANKTKAFLAVLENAAAGNFDGFVLSTQEWDRASVKGLIPDAKAVAVVGHLPSSSVDSSSDGVLAIGTNSVSVGIKTGEEILRSVNVTHALCVVSQFAEVDDVTRCEAMIQTLTSNNVETAKLLSVPAGLSNLFIVEQALNVTLSSLDESDACVIVVQKGRVARIAEQVIRSLGRTKDSIVSFTADEVSKTMLENGELLFAVDHQDYLAGYLAATLTTSVLSRGVRPVNPALLSGPVFRYRDDPAFPHKKISETKIEMIVHGRNLDLFWDDFKRGVSVAAKDLNLPLKDCTADAPGCSSVEPPSNTAQQGYVSFRNSGAQFDLTEIESQIKLASLQNPDGMVLSIPNWRFLSRVVSNQVLESNIPAISINAGGESSIPAGFLMHVGQNETYAGIKVGEKIGQLDYRKVVCVNHEKGTESLNERFNGIKQGLQAFGGEVHEVLVDYGNSESFLANVLPHLQNDTFLMLLGSPGAANIIYQDLKRELGTVPLIGVFDVTPGLDQLLEKGIVAFAVQQQQHLQAYFSIVSSALYASTGQVLTTPWVHSGPAFVTTETFHDTLCQSASVCDLVPENNSQTTLCPIPQAVGDHWCDPENNIEACGYDGGDCCAETCDDSSGSSILKLFQCGTDHFDVGRNNFQCVDPRTNEGLRVHCKSDPKDPRCEALGLRDPTLFNLGLLLSLTTPQEAENQTSVADLQSYLGAALLAAKHFNERNASVIKAFGSPSVSHCNKRIALQVQDTKSELATSIQAVMQLLSGDKADVIIGPSTSESTLRTALLSSAFQVPQLSYGATSTKLDDRISYPYFLRTIPSDTTTARAICAYWRQLDFRFAAMLLPDTDDANAFKTSLVPSCEKVSVDVLTFTYSTGDSKSWTRTLQEVANVGLNVVLLYPTDEQTLKQLLTEAMKANILRQGTLWTFVDHEILGKLVQFEDANLRKFLNGSVTIKPQGGSESRQEYQSFLSAWSSTSFDSDLWLGVSDKNFQDIDPRESEALAYQGAYIFDSIAYAALLACEISPREAINNTFARHFGQKRVSFDGLTGTIALDASGNRQPETATLLLSNIFFREHGELDISDSVNIAEEVVVSRAVFRNGTFVFDCYDTCHTKQWFNGGTQEKPSDMLSPVQDYDTIDVLAPVSVSLAALNMALAVCFIAWVFFNQSNPVVKAAQIPFLVVIAIGGLVSSLAILPLTVTDLGPFPGSVAGPTGGNQMADLSCMLTPWLYCLGFVLTFAPLFFKLKRVRSVFTFSGRSIARSSRLSRSNDKGPKKNSVSSWNLLVTVVNLFVCEAIVLTVWSVVDPLVYIRIPVETNEFGQVLSSTAFCSSDHWVWFVGILGCFHVSLLLYGAFLCYKTSRINSAFSESKYVTISIVSYLQVVLIAVPVLVILPVQTSIRAFLFTMVIFLNDLTCMVLIFVPKIYYAHWGTVSEGLGADIIAKRQSIFRAQRQASSTRDLHQESSADKSFLRTLIRSVSMIHSHPGHTDDANSTPQTAGANSVSDLRRQDIQLV